MRINILLTLNYYEQRVNNLIFFEAFGFLAGFYRPGLNSRRV